MTTRINLAQFGLPLLAASTLVLPDTQVSAAPLVSFGDHASLFFNGSVTVRATDNLYLDPVDEESEVIFIFAPGLELNIGARANANVNIYYREDFYRYNDNSQLDSNYSNIFLESYWSQPRLELRLNASYEQLVQPTPDTVLLPGQLVERDFTRASVRGEYDLGDRSSLSMGVNASFLRFDQALFVDRDTIGIPVNFYYELTPLVDLSLGYRFRNTDTGDREVGGVVVPVADYRDHYFNVGARGELAPKLVGEARIGYQEREIRGAGTGGDQSTVSFGVDLSHYTTPRTTLTAGLFRDFETGGRGASITNTGGSLGVQHAFSHLISGQAAIAYFNRDWNREAAPESVNREDDTYDFSLGLTYSPNVYLNLNAGYVFRKNDSNIDGFDYDNNIFSISAALRF